MPRTRRAAPAGPERRAGGGVHGDLGDVPNALERLRRRRLPCPKGDERAGVRLAHERDGRHARERELDRALAVIAQAIPNAGGETLVRDPNVLPQAEAGDARERAGRRLEDEAHRARLALRGELIGQRAKAHRVVAADLEAVLEERWARIVVLEQRHDPALLRADSLVDGR